MVWLTTRSIKLFKFNYTTSQDVHYPLVLCRVTWEALGAISTSNNANIVFSEHRANIYIIAVSIGVFMAEMSPLKN